jgi:hypothetical protein
MGLGMDMVVSLSSDIDDGNDDDGDDMDNHVSDQRQRRLCLNPCLGIDDVSVQDWLEAPSGAAWQSGLGLGNTRDFGKGAGRKRNHVSH